MQPRQNLESKNRRLKLKKTDLTKTLYSRQIKFESLVVQFKLLVSLMDTQNIEIQWSLFKISLIKKINIKKKANK